MNVTMPCPSGYYCSLVVRPDSTPADWSQALVLAGIIALTIILIGVLMVVDDKWHPGR